MGVNQEELHWIDEICACNGLQSEKSSLNSIEHIELFLSSIHIIPSMKCFINLSLLKFVGSNISKIANLCQLVNLKELWICEGNLKRIEALDSNIAIEKLYLYSNQIERIENLSLLVKLKTLWLNKNKISIIENLSDLVELQNLNLSDNNISKIGKSLSCNAELEELNLSGNLIFSLKDITILACLPKLVSLSLNDPLSSTNPVGLLANYTTFILYHLPCIKHLDSFDVSQGLKNAAETTVMKKKTFYRVQIKKVNRMFYHVKSILREELCKMQESSDINIRKICYSIKELEREFWQSEKKKNSHKIDTSDTIQKNETRLNKISKSFEEFKKMVTEKSNLLTNRIKYWETVHQKLYLIYKDIVKQLTYWKEQSIIFLRIEFMSGGNIRFEEGTNNDFWYQPCHDLVQSRFFAQEFKDSWKIVNLKIQKIFCVQNRILKLRFDKKAEVILRTEDYNESFSSLRHEFMDYLFLISESCADFCLEKILEDGFCNENASMAVKLTNSVYIADKARIKNVYKSIPDCNIQNCCTSRFGKLFICKVLIGPSAAYTNDKEINSTSYPGINSVYKSKQHTASECTSQQNVRKNNLCDCTLRQCSWFVFDPSLVLIEYIVDFEYETNSTHPLIDMFSNILPCMDVNPLYQKVNLNDIYAKEFAKDREIINMEPVVKSRPRLTFLTEELLLHQSGQTNLSKITVLNLHDCGLSRVKLLSSLQFLKRLVLSFNELTSINELNGMNSLEYLDVSFNQIESFEGLKIMPNISHLDITWNYFCHTRNEVTLLKNYFPLLKVLNISHNPWMNSSTVRLRCISRIRTLTVIDKKPVTEEELQTALHLVSSSRITSAAILNNSCTDIQEILSLRLENTVDTLILLSGKRPIISSPQDGKWMAKITCLCLANHHLSKISNIENLVNLKWASFNNNDITKIEGLESCTKLQELTLSGNCISKIDGMNHLVDLQFLDISNNIILSLEGLNFEKLHKLSYIAFDNNNVISLNGFQKSKSLVEIYAGNNKIKKLREIFYLKKISSLCILDLLGNPMCKELSYYRLYAIYHLHYLKMLDAVSLELSEVETSKDTFGGRLTTDYLVEKLGHSNFLEICELDMPNCNLRSVELSSKDIFNNLRSLNLEQNNLTCFGGIFQIVNLKVLCLNYNFIECIIPKSFENATKDEQNKPILHNLEVLHLGYNGIRHMSLLKLDCLPSLKMLFLQGNEISKVEGLENLCELRELVLDKNKLKCLHETSFINQKKLKELHIENNMLQKLNYLEELVCLERLYIGSNRIQDTLEFEKLINLTKLFEISLIDNPVTRRHMHRPFLIFHRPSLLYIDGIVITNDERIRAELHFIEQQTNPLDQSTLNLVPKSKKLLEITKCVNNLTIDDYWFPYTYDSNDIRQVPWKVLSQIPSNQRTSKKNQ
ncbi:leucine-rich repeat-containing protein 9 isoform X2 [Hydra vulgaris]|uniref:Leucine-rich repeat-containing protein 9 isoform X2 n=1 Tax=Hydra vulgaris TaxID=6087 RepID=A0ABM4BRI3_HYDVU